MHATNSTPPKVGLKYILNTHSPQLTEIFLNIFLARWDGGRGGGVEGGGKGEEKMVSFNRPKLV